MKIGIKYCGGCNSIYDRGKKLKKFQSDHPDHEYVTSGDNCDYWMMICGCDRKCVNTENYYAKRKIVMLADDLSFISFGKELEESASKDVFSKRTVTLRDVKTLTRKITKEDVDAFAKLTGDYNKLHFDADVAEMAGFERPIVHGMFAYSLLSTVMGNELPGAGTVFVSGDTRFMRPAYIGDTLEASIEFVSYTEDENAYTGTFRGVVKNQNGERILTAQFVQKMPKSLFEIEKGE